MASPFADRSSEALEHRNGNASHPIFEGYDHAKSRREEAEADGDRNRSGDSQEPSPDGGEKGSSSGSSSPKLVGFWDPKLRQTRNHVFFLWGRTTLILSTFILGILSLYWAVLFHVNDKLPSLVDFDGAVAPYDDPAAPPPLVGPMITQLTETQVATNAPMHLGYVTVPHADFAHDPLQVRDAVCAQETWAAVVVNAKATALLRAAVQTGNASYDPLGACQIVYVQARDQDTYSNYVLPILSMLQTNVQAEFGKTWTRHVLADASIPREAIATAPQALSPGIGFSTATPATTVGLIYLIIVAFFSFTFFLPIPTQLTSPDGHHPPLRFRQLILWRWTSTIAAYLFMSLAYSLVSLTFRIPFDDNPAQQPHDGANAFGRGTFPVYWMIDFVAMVALGLACENVATVVGQPWTAFWLIFWVISNVCTSFYPTELSPRFFYWGYAWPLHNTVEATRTTLFDTHGRLGLNSGVLFVWAAVNSIVFPFCVLFMRWKSQKEKEKGEKGREMSRIG